MKFLITTSVHIKNKKKQWINECELMTVASSPVIPQQHEVTKRKTMHTPPPSAQINNAFKGNKAKAKMVRNDLEGGTQCINKMQEPN